MCEKERERHREGGEEVGRERERERERVKENTRKTKVKRDSPKLAKLLETYFLKTLETFKTFKKNFVFLFCPKLISHLKMLKIISRLSGRHSRVGIVLQRLKD